MGLGCRLKYALFESIVKLIIRKKGFSEKLVLEIVVEDSWSAWILGKTTLRLFLRIHSYDWNVWNDA